MNETYKKKNHLSRVAMNELNRVGFWGSLKILSCEYSTNPLLKNLDLKCGIDLIAFDNDAVEYPIALRVQNGTDFRTFTIRKKIPNVDRTEWDKLKDSYSNNIKRPLYHIQIYFTESGKFDRVGVIFTDDLINYINVTPDITTRINNDDGVEFYVIEWYKIPHLMIPLVDGKFSILSKPNGKVSKTKQIKIDW